MVLEFRFYPGFRVPAANIEVTFRAAEKDRRNGRDVTVEVFGPLRLYSSETTRESVTSEFSVSPNVSVNAGSAPVGVSLSDKRTSFFDTVWGGFVKADSSPAPGHETKNTSRSFFTRTESKGRMA